MSPGRGCGRGEDEGRRCHRHGHECGGNIIVAEDIIGAMGTGAVRRKGGGTTGIGAIEGSNNSVVRLAKDVVSTMGTGAVRRKGCGIAGVGTAEGGGVDSSGRSRRKGGVF